MNNTLLKVFFVILSCTVSMIAQLNLKVTANALPTSFETLMSFTDLRGLLLVMRAGFLSGGSLLITWYAYRKFGFLELIVAQSAAYIFALVTSVLFLQEPLQLNRVAAIILIMLGIGTFYWK